MRTKKNMEELEKLLASISLSYLHLLPEQASLEFERSLQTLGEAVRADRAYQPVFTRIVTGVRQRTRYKHALLQSESRYRMLFNSNSDAIVVVDRDRLITDCNPAFTDLFGYSREEVLGRTTKFLFASQEEYLALGERMRRHDDKSGILYEVRYRRKSGESFDGEKRLQHLRGEQGEIGGFIATIRDVSLRKAAEAKIKTLLEEKEILMHEVHHRVKNNMGAISSLLALQADAVNEPAAIVALEDARTRMQSMEVLYDKLYRTENLSELYLSDYLPALAQEILHAVPSGAAVSLDTEGIEAIPAGVKLLSSLGMILNEIISNALKHAFPGRNSGSIIITARRYPLDSEPDRLKIVVADDGQGIPEVAGPDQNRKEGFGFTLIRALTEQLQGTVLMERGDAGTGTRVVLDIPLE